MKRKAERLAETAHRGQWRKFQGVQYAEHPKTVAGIVSSLNGSELLQTVALLHDTVEDTLVSFEDLKEEFGRKVANLVFELTNDDGKIEETSKTEYMKKKMANMTDEALLVKLADRAHNTSDLSGAPDFFSIRYGRETRKILEYVKQNREFTNRQGKLVSKIEQNI